jgi:hypothetical protein
VQLGLPETDKPGILSDEEERVLRFHEAYARAMADAGPADAAAPADADGSEACAASCGAGR